MFRIGDKVVLTKDYKKSEWYSVVPDCIRRKLPLLENKILVIKKVVGNGDFIITDFVDWGISKDILKIVKNYLMGSFGNFLGSIGESTGYLDCNGNMLFIGDIIRTSYSKNTYVTEGHCTNFCERIVSYQELKNGHTVENIEAIIKETKGHLYRGENFYGKLGQKTLLKDRNGICLKVGDIVSVNGRESIVVRNNGDYIMGIKLACDKGGNIDRYNIVKTRGYETLRDGEFVNCIDISVYAKRKYSEHEIAEAEKIIGEELSTIEHVTIKKRKCEESMSVGVNFHDYVYYAHDDGDSTIGTMYCLCKITDRKLPDWFYFW